MKDTKLERRRDNTLSVATLGLRLEVSPYTLVQQMMNENSQAIVDKLIEEGFKRVLQEFDEWEKSMIEELKRTKEDPDEVIEKYKYSVHVQQIQNVADYSRNILPLHSDAEYFVHEEDLTKSTECAYTYWRYNKFYGFKD